MMCDFDLKNFIELNSSSLVRVDLELGVVAERRRPRPPGHVRQEQLLLREVNLKRQTCWSNF